MRGGAPTVAQRVAFDAAMARWGAGEPAVAVAMLDQLDMGPEPDAGYPQFWERAPRARRRCGRAEQKPRAEAEWAALCAPDAAEPARDPHERREGGGEQSRAGAVRRVRRPDG